MDNRVKAGHISNRPGKTERVDAVLGICLNFSRSSIANSNSMLFNVIRCYSCWYHCWAHTDTPEQPQPSLRYVP